MKTENLAILITDIVGFTEATAQQSRSENEKLLAVHNRILYPVIRHYGGKIIKTIGDALLIVFKSPTDAMLCAMAMQDALFEYNKSVPENKNIHIRVAASLGEVRVVHKDIFGEPVNLTSRIEGITPRDEIYLSDAVYMAMNKAEVPCVEVGLKTLKGVSEPVKIWQIPRFSRPRLVPEDVMNSEDISDIAYPYGGAHLTAKKPEKKIPSFEVKGIAWVAGIVLFLIICFSVIYLFDWSRESPSVDMAASKIERKSEDIPDLLRESADETNKNQEAVEAAAPSEDSKASSTSSPVTDVAASVQRDSKDIYSKTKPVPQGPSSLQKKADVSIEQPEQKTMQASVSPEPAKPEIKETGITTTQPQPSEDPGSGSGYESRFFSEAYETETEQLQTDVIELQQENGLDPEIENLVQSLHSYDSAERRQAAKIIARSYGSNPVLLEEVEKVLLSGYNEQIEDGHHVDAIAWMCRILGATGDEKYRETLSTIATSASNRKIQKYAEAALNDL